MVEQRNKYSTKDQIDPVAPIMYQNRVTGKPCNWSVIAYKYWRCHKTLFAFMQNKHVSHFLISLTATESSHCQQCPIYQGVPYSWRLLRLLTSDISDATHYWQAGELKHQLTRRRLGAEFLCYELSRLQLDVVLFVNPFTANPVNALHFAILV